MRIQIPWHDTLPQYAVSVVTPRGTVTATVDDSHREVEIELPPGVSEDEAEVIGRPCGRDGLPLAGAGPVVIKPAVSTSRTASESLPEPPVGPTPQAEAEPHVEPKPEYPRRQRMPAAVAPGALEETRGCARPNAEAIRPRSATPDIAAGSRPTTSKSSPSGSRPAGRPLAAATYSPVSAVKTATLVAKSLKRWPWD